MREDPVISVAVRTMVTEWSGDQLAGLGLITAKASRPAYERLETIGVPILAIVGEGDDPDMVAIADMVERRVPGARKVLVEGAGHLVNLEKPAEVNGALLDFWQAVGGAVG